MDNTTLEQLSVLITANNKGLQQALEEVKKDVKGLETETKKTTESMTKMFTKLKSTVATLGIGAILKKTIGDALNYIGNDTQFMSTMNKWSENVTEFTNDLKNKLGVSRSEMRNFISTMYNMFSGMGVGDVNSFKMSKSLAMLSQDMASFYNISASDALDKLQSGLAGNSLALRQLGIMIDDTTVKQYALENGFTGSWEALDQSTKAMYRYNAIMEKTGFMHGYLANTIDSPVTGVRMLKDSIKTLSQTFGQLFIPVISAVLPYLQAFVKLATMAVEAVARLFNIKIGTELTSSLVGASGGASSIADNMERAGAGTDTITNNLKNTNKQADKLKRTMAGFDSMNVLQEDGSVSNIGNPNANVPNVNTNMPSFEIPVIEYDYSQLDGIKNKVDEIIEGILSKFDKFKTINLEPLKLSFFSLIEAIKPLGSLVSVVVQGFIDKVLLPLTKWTIEKALPTFFDLLTQVLRVLTPVLQNFLTFGSWLFDKFLLPIANWTGGAIISTLNFLAGAFKKVADSQSALNGLTTVLGVLMAIKLAGWFSNLSQAIGIYAVSAGSVKEITEAYGTMAGKVVGKMSPLIDIYKKYNDKLLETKGILSPIKTASEAVGGAFVTLGSKVTELGTKFSHPITSLKDLWTKFKEGDGIKGVFNGFVDFIKDKGETLAIKLLYVKDGFSDMIQNMKDKSQSGESFVGGAFASLKGAISGAMSGAGNIVQSVFSGIGNGLTALGTAIKANPLGFLLTVFSLLMSSSEEFRECIQNLMKQALEPIGKVATLVMKCFEPFLDILVMLIETAIKPLTPLLELLGNAISFILKPLEIASNIVGGVVNGLLGFFGIKTEDTKENAQETAEALKACDEQTQSLTKSMYENARELERNGKGQSDLAQLYRDSEKAYKVSGDALKKSTEATINDKEATEKTKEAHEKYSKAVQDRIDLVKEIEEVERGFADTQLSLMDAEDKLAEKQAIVNQLKAEGKEGTREYERAVLELESAQNNLLTKQEQVADQQEVMNNSNAELEKSNRNVERSFNAFNLELDKTGNAINNTNGKYTTFTRESQKNTKDLENQTKTSTSNNTSFWSNFNKAISDTTKTTYQKVNKEFTNNTSEYQKALAKQKAERDAQVKYEKTKLEENQKNNEKTNKLINDDVKSTFTKVKESVEKNTKDWKTNTDTIQSTSKTDFGKIATYASTDLRTNLNNATNNLSTDAKNNFSKVTNEGKNSLTNISNAWTNSSTGLQAVLKKVFTNIASDMPKSFSGIADKFKTIASDIINPIGKAFNGVISGMNSLSSKLGSKLSFSTIPLPLAKFASGSDGLKRDTLGVVNDQKGSVYKELIVEPSGNAFIPKGRDVVLPMKKGTKILPANRTKKFLEGLPHFASGIGSFVGNWTNSISLGTDKEKIVADPKNSMQTVLNAFVPMPNKPLDNLVSNFLGNKLFSSMVEWFKKSFPMDMFGMGEAISKFVERYKNTWVDVFGRFGNVGNGGAPNFSGQCASLATAWLSQAFGYWFSSNGSGFGASGRAVGKQDAKNGDIIYWGATGGNPYGHVAVYTGNNKMFEQNAPSLGAKATIQPLRGGNFIRPRGNMKIPRYERGGIIDEATLALVGENGKEAVLPIENNLGWLQEIANILDAKMENKKKNNSENHTTIVNVLLDGKNITTKVIEEINNLTYRDNDIPILI